MIKKRHLLIHGLCMLMLMSTSTVHAAPITNHNVHAKRQNLRNLKLLKKKQKQLDIKWEKGDWQEDAWICYSTTDWYKDQEDLICSFKHTRVGDNAEIFGYSGSDVATAKTAMTTVLATYHGTTEFEKSEYKPLLTAILIEVNNSKNNKLYGDAKTLSGQIIENFFDSIMQLNVSPYIINEDLKLAIQNTVFTLKDDNYIRFLNENNEKYGNYYSVMSAKAFVEKHKKTYKNNYCRNAQIANNVLKHYRTTHFKGGDGQFVAPVHCKYSKDFSTYAVHYDTKGTKANVYSILEGEVIKIRKSNKGTWGKFVSVKSQNGIIITYAGLGDVNVTEGQHVNLDSAPLGTTGNTGTKFTKDVGVYLDIRRDGLRVNPKKVFK